MTLLELLRDLPVECRPIVDAAVAYAKAQDATAEDEHDWGESTDAVLEAAYVLGHAIADARRDAGGS